MYAIDFGVVWIGHWFGFFSSSAYREVADVCFQWLESVLFSFFCCGAHCNAQSCIVAKV